MMRRTVWLRTLGRSFASAIRRARRSASASSPKGGVENVQLKSVLGEDAELRADLGDRGIPQSALADCELELVGGDGLLRCERREQNRRDEFGFHRNVSLLLGAAPGFARQVYHQPQL